MTAKRDDDPMQSEAPPSEGAPVSAIRRVLRRKLRSWLDTFDDLVGAGRE